MCGWVNALGKDCKNPDGIYALIVSQVSWSSNSILKESNLEIVHGVSESVVHPKEATTQLQTVCPHSN